MNQDYWVQKLRDRGFIPNKPKEQEKNVESPVEQVAEVVEPKFEGRADLWIEQMSSLPRFKRYSQTGEEGYLKHILENIGFGDRHLVDIGAWDGYHLSNTRYFIEEYDYRGLLIDGDNRGNSEVQQRWITKDNILDIMREYNVPKNFSLLCFDTDGNDYDILENMCSEYKPDVIVCEVNGTIPLGVSKKIQYNPNHVWNNDDYYGFSMSAGLKLAEKIGYRIVFQNDALNLYLVRKDLLGNPNAQINLNFQHNQYHPHNSTGVWVEV